MSYSRCALLFRIAYGPTRDIKSMFFEISILYTLYRLGLDLRQFVEHMANFHIDINKVLFYWSESMNELNVIELHPSFSTILPAAGSASSPFF